MSTTARHPPLRFLLIALIILGVLHAYIGWRLLPNLPIPEAMRVLGACWLVVSWGLIPFALFARLIRHEWLSSALGWAGTLSMGLFSSVLVLTVLRDIILSVAWVFLPTASLLSLSTDSSVAVLVVALAMTLIGLFNARRAARVVTVDIPLANLPPALDGFCIVQLSDLHVGPTIKRGYLRRIIERTNALNADLIAVTGDVVDGSVAALGPHVAPLAQLYARHGACFVTGNHEYYAGEAEWSTEFARLGLRVLKNQHIVLNIEDARLVIGGVTDFSAGQFVPQEASDPHAAIVGAPSNASARILLAHQPRSADKAESAGWDVQLSGHTHGGQFWPWNYFVRLQQPYTAGLHQHGRLWVYISRGTGYWGPPKRLGAPAEITRIRLVAQRSLKR